MSTTAVVFNMVLFVIDMFIMASALEWIFNLEKIECKCSEDYRRDYIKYTIILYIIINPILFLYTTYNIMYNKIPIQSIYITVVRLILMIVFLVNLVFSIEYIQKLKNNKCGCSEDQKREIYNIYNWIRVGLLSLTALVLLISFIIVCILSIAGRNK